MHAHSASRRVIQRLGFIARGRRELLTHYEEFRASERWTHDRLVDTQLEHLKSLVGFAEHQCPYYRELFRENGFTTHNIHRIKDLEKLPILTKRAIREHWKQIVPDILPTVKYVQASTGGSTGEPLSYLMSKDDHLRGIALLYRGWGFGGYQLGDRVAILAGASLIPSTRSTLRKKLREYVLNMRFYSSFGMDAAKTVEDLNRFKPTFIRGYASSIHYVANFIRSHDVRLRFTPIAVFTTSEMLLSPQRTAIEDAFKAPVFDNYGLNDGGVSAYECREHAGMHIDMERAILEVVDEDGMQVIGRPGRILATSLHNRAFPFIRYDTGDIGTIEEGNCSCGRETPRLSQLLGRTTEILEINGRAIGSPVLTVLFGKCDIEQYQIVQESAQRITCRVVKGAHYSGKDERLIRQSLSKHLGEIEIAFEYADSIPAIDGRKHRFIVNRTRSVDPSSSHPNSA